MEETFTAQVMQFLRPDGRRRMATTELPVSCLADYREMRSSRCRLEAEVLTTGMVHVTVSNHEDDLDFIICSNSKGLQERIAVMLKRHAWRRATK